MRKLLAVTMLSLAVASLAGCNSCRQMTRGWFNHGDRCDPYPPPTDCPPGMPRATMMIPNSTTVLPGAIEVAPQ
jgi:hypothetical protein